MKRDRMEAFLLTLMSGAVRFGKNTYDILAVWKCCGNIIEIYSRGNNPSALMVCVVST